MNVRMISYAYFIFVSSTIVFKWCHASEGWHPAKHSVQSSLLHILSNNNNAMPNKTLRLKKHEERRLRHGHLWIYSNEVDVAQTPLQDFAAGEVVNVETHKGEILGSAYIN